MQLGEPKPQDWIAAIAPAAAVGLLCFGGLLGGGQTAHRVTASEKPDHREATNVAAMATRDYYTATQDRNPLMAFMHITSAAAYLAAARRLSTDEALSLGLDTNVRSIASDIDELQRRITARLGKHNRSGRSLPA